MSQVDLVVLYADVSGFPQGTFVSGVQVDLSGAASNASQTVSGDTGTVSFHDLAAGTYSYSVAALDGSGAVLGTAVTGSFEIAAPTTVTLSLPASVSATVTQ